LFLQISALSQETVPAELPIEGEPNIDIFLDLAFPKGPSLFFLNGKKLQLLSPLDRDENSVSHIVFQVTIFPQKMYLHGLSIDFTFVRGSSFSLESALIIVCGIRDEDISVCCEKGAKVA
jgi:hypothetical protein